MDVGALRCDATGKDVVGNDREPRAEQVHLDSASNEALTELRGLLEADPVLKAPTETADLLRFLRIRKYDVNASLDTIKKYCAIQASSPRLFEGLRDPARIRELTQDIVTVLPQKNLQGKPIVVQRSGRWQPSKISYTQVMQGLVLCLEHASRDPAAQTEGVAYISDFEGWSFGHIRALELGIIRDYMHYLQNCLPVIANECHIVREPATFSILYALTKPFMKDETVKSIMFHKKDVHRLRKYISPSALPADYGGTAPDTDWNLFWTKIVPDKKAGCD